MTPARRRFARLPRTALLVGVLAFAASSCTTNNANLQLAVPGSSPPAAATIPAMMADAAADHAAGNSVPVGAAPTAPGPSASGAAVAGQTAAVTPVPTDGASATANPADPLLPDVVAYVPTASPGNPFAAAMPALRADATNANGIPNQGVSEALPETAMIPKPNPAIGDPAPAPGDAPGTTANIPAQAAAYAEPTAPASAPKRRGFFATLFSPPADRAIAAKASAHEQPIVMASLDTDAAKPLINTGAPTKPVVDLSPAAPAVTAAPHQYIGSDALPGVRNGNSLFEITRKSNVGDNSDVDINEEDGGSVEVASAAGMARLDPNGLLLQRETVDTACLRPALLSELKRIEQHYGSKLVVTSGYRNPIHNAAARGAHNSLHMFCAAADVQMPGVSKWELAAYARSMPGRGGVGTYCYTKSVHIDIGPERDWNWRCRRKRHR